jgi:AcrR family transcriptional regulator
MAVTSKRALTERRAPTHARLVEAATKVVARRGFHAATVDEIAEEAGFSIGALYSNFDGKDDVFLAVFDGHLRWFEERLEESASAEDPTRAFKDWMDSLMREPEQLLIFIEFWAYAVRRPKLRRSFAARMAEMRADMAVALEQRAERTGGELQLPAATLAIVLLAMARGLGIEKLADDDAVDDSVAQLVASLVP